MESLSRLKAFDFLRSSCADSYEIIGDGVLVEEIPLEEMKTKSGIIMAPIKVRNVDSVEANAPVYVRVLDVGKGFYDEATGEDVALNCSPGDIALVGKLSVRWFSIFGPFHDGPRIGIVRESEFNIRFKGQEGYDKVNGALAQGM